MNKKKYGYVAWLDENGDIKSEMDELNIPFAIGVRKDVEKYFNLIKGCNVCKSYYFCDYEHREILPERSLVMLYEKIISEHPITDLYLTLNKTNDRLFGDLLMSGLYIYTINRLKNEKPEMGIANLDYDEIYSKLLGLYEEMMKGCLFDE